ncbi:MAG: IS66 family transposase [Desulfobacteraceae bacterium]|jgi:transposase
MNIELSSLPNDVSSLKEVIAEQQRSHQKVQEQVNYLEEMVRLLKAELFGRKSEVRRTPDADQLQLFTQPGVPAPEPVEDVAIEAHTRKKRGRKPLPDDLPRVEVIHDIPEDEKHCACGTDLTPCGQEVCEKLDYTPAKLQVIRHIRLKYACKGCEGVEDTGPTVKIAPPVTQLIPKSIATEGLLAHVAVSKFADGLPLYRQQKIFKRHGVDLSRTTLAGWIIQASGRCLPLLELLENEIRGGPLINIDESTLQVLNEPGRSNTSKSYMWVFCGGNPERKAVVYQYHPTRSGQVPLDFLDGYQGYVQSDAFAGYDQVGRQKGIVHVGCFAHARRKFVEVTKVRKKARGGNSPKGLADEALDFIGNLYAIEKKAKKQGLSFDEIYRLRQEESKPILDQFKLWLEANQPLTPPKGLLGKAIQYALNHWDKLAAYIQDGRLKPDNNVAENAIRPCVVGRKNWLFAGAPKGAEASATFFSLIETAKANGHEPYAYLHHIFKKLPLVTTGKEYEALLPWNVDPTAIASGEE